MKIGFMVKVIYNMAINIRRRVEWICFNLSSWVL